MRITIGEFNLWAARPRSIRHMSRVLNLLTRLARGRLFDHHGNLVAFTLNNMTQGVVLWDTTGRLVVRNDRYLTMHRISPDLAKRGTALIDILRHRVATGSLQRDDIFKRCARLPGPDVDLSDRPQPQTRC